jgi:hypothetical protein
MKNIFVLPTDKPSRLHNKNGELGNYPSTKLYIEDFKGNQYNSFHVYITDDSKIKEGDWVLNTNTNSIAKYTGHGSMDWWVKITLTTDQDLIKDGVQAIDDEFLKWWIKNPSCEYVVVYFNYKKFRWSGLNKSQCYEIIIPQEENNMNKETLEEAAEKYASKQSDNQMCTDNIEYSKSSQELWEESKVDFISGALSDAARDYWYEKFQNEK